MKLEDYLEENIKADVLKKANEFIDSYRYQVIKTYTSSSKYQTARMQLKLRDKNIHKNTLTDIQKLQDKIVVPSNRPNGKTPQRIT